MNNLKNVIIAQKDSYTPTHEESCDNYCNHFISFVIYNVERRLYIIIENGRGTIVSDRYCSVHVVKSKDDFDFSNEYIKQAVPKVDSEVEIGVLSILNVDKHLNTFVDNVLSELDKKIDLEWKNYSVLCDIIIRNTQNIPVGNVQGSMVYALAYNNLENVFKELKKHYGYLSYFGITQYNFKEPVIGELIKEK